MLRIPRANAFRRNPLTVSGAEARELLLSRGGDDPEFVGMVVQGDLYLVRRPIQSLPEGLVVGGDLDLRETPIESLPAGLTVGKDLKLYFMQIRSLPAGLRVGGNLFLSKSQIQSLPADLKVGGILDLSDTPIESLPEGLKVGGHLLLDHTPIRSLPEGLQVGGKLNLSHTPIQSLPADLKVGGGLWLNGTPIESLPEGLRVGGDLILSFSKIRSLPAGLVVGRTLDLSNTQIQSLPEGLKVGGNLDLSNLKIRSLPAGLKVRGDLYLKHTPIESLPAGLVVGGNLDLRYSQIRSLSEGLMVGGDLNLERMPIKSLPANLKVRGDLNLEHTPIESLPEGLVVGRNLNLLGTRVRVLPPDLRVGGEIDGFDFSTPPDQIFPVTSYGKMTGTILKLNKPDSPQTLTELQQRYPNEFERFRSAMTNAKVGASPKAPIAQVKKAVEAHSLSPTPWLLTYGVYKSTAQRYCKSPNKVIKLNIDISKYDKAQRKSLRLLAAAAKLSGHPHEWGDLFTIGWVRICEDDQNKIWLIEEIQSDVQTVRHKKDLSRYPRLAAAAEVMAPIAKRFYYDIMGIVFDKAEKLGYTVQMLDYPAKKIFGSPSVNYTSLPQDMGMRLTSEPSLTLPQVGPVWSYKPNPRRRR